jgi:transcriptional regulator with XRE-family HTH domain
MAQGVSPVVARRRLRLELRKLREEREYTQGQVAAALEWSLSKMQRIEGGDVTVSRNDLVALLGHLGVTTQEHVDYLADLARTARKRITHWWDEPQYKEALTPATIKLIELETDASEIRVFHPTLLPGMLQTEAYARLILDFWHHELSEEERNVRFEVRMRRQSLLDGPDRPKYLVVLDESVLIRALGGPEIMAAQLQHLLSLMRDKRIGARVVRLADAAPLAMLNQFVVLTFSDGDTILYREAQLVDEIIERPSTVGLYRQRFERIWEDALSQEESAHLIAERASAMLGGI